jgi:hypothetical protein
MIKTIFVMSFFAVAAFFFGSTSYAQAQSYSYSTHYGNQTMCTMDAYVCPNGTTVGRTGPHCQFVCPGTATIPPVCSSTYCMGAIPSSYYYTSGCYTYYYNGYTRTTTVTSYNCQNYVTPQQYYPYYSYYPATTQYYSTYSYPVQTTYTSPVTYTTPVSQYQTYSYCNGSWILSSQRGSGCNNIFGF